MILVKIFCGCPLPYDVAQSAGWKESRILRPTTTGELETVAFEDKEYVGLFSQEKTTLDLLEAQKKEILLKLKAYAPEVRIPQNSFRVFPQVLLS